MEQMDFFFQPIFQPMWLSVISSRLIFQTEEDTKTKPQRATHKSSTKSKNITKISKNLIDSFKKKSDSFSKLQKPGELIDKVEQWRF